MMRQQCKRGVMRAPAVMCEMRYLVVVALAALTAACATLTPDSPTEEKVKLVTERSAARWQAIIDGDFAKAYGYLSPASRATVTAAGFKTVASRMDYRAIRVTGASCEAEKCRVGLVLTYNAKAALNSAVARKGNESVAVNGVNTPLTETWVIDQGQIWYVWPI
jgi:hypothetical protein